MYVNEDFLDGNWMCAHTYFELFDFFVSICIYNIYYFYIIIARTMCAEFNII